MNDADSRSMRMALGIHYPITPARLRFVKQLGIDDIVVWGSTFPGDSIAHRDLVLLRTLVEDHGLRIAAIEALPVHWYDRVMLGRDGRDLQLDGLAEVIRNIGRAGIPILTYAWNPTGVWRTSHSWRLRGGAVATAFDSEALKGAPLSFEREYAEEEVWSFYEYFLRALVPVAEEAGVVLSIHPNDPPVEAIGGYPFLLRSRRAIDRALAVVPSSMHAITLCLGSWGEMGEDLVDLVRHYGPQGQIQYVHFQATNGAVPRFNETFIDLADYDPFRLLAALREVGFHGVMIPGHTPTMEGDTEWRESFVSGAYNFPMGGYRGRAFTVGYLRGLLAALERDPGLAPTVTRP